MDRNTIVAFACLFATACGQADGEPEDLAVDTDEIEATLADDENWERIGTVDLVDATPTAIARARDIADSGTASDTFPGGYAAMLVLADGTAFGQVGDSPAAPLFSPEDSAGIPDDYDPDWILDHAEELIAEAGPEQTGTVHRLGIGDPEATPVLLGNDNRLAVNSTSTLTSYPWRTVGSMLYNGTNSTNGACTGTKIGPRHIITAAHCLHNCAGGWFNNVWFSPGQQGDQQNNGGPRGMVARYARTCSLSNDYGLLIVGDNAQFVGLGWVGYGWWSNLNTYKGKPVWVRGYPVYTQTCVNSPRADDQCGGFMYSHYTSLPNVNHTSGYLYHSSDATGGQSGNSLIYFLGSTPISLGVHKRGNEPSSGATITASPASYNIAPRMRGAMWNDICNWIGIWPSQNASHPCQ